MIGSVAFLVAVAAARVRGAAGALVAAARGAAGAGAEGLPRRAAAPRAARPGEDAGADALVAAPAADAGAGGGDPRLRRAGPEPAAGGDEGPAARPPRRRLGRRAGLGRRMDRAAAALDDGGARPGGRRRCVHDGGARRWPARSCRGGPASEWRERLAGLTPAAWAPDRAGLGGVDRRARTGAFETLWLEDGIGHGGEAELARALLAHGPVTLVGAAARPRWR